MTHEQYFRRMGILYADCEDGVSAGGVQNECAQVITAAALQIAKYYNFKNAEGFAYRVRQALWTELEKEDMTEADEYARKKQIEEYRDKCVRKIQKALYIKDVPMEMKWRRNLTLGAERTETKRDADILNETIWRNYYKQERLKENEGVGTQCNT